MARSLKKGPYVDNKLLNKIKLMNKSGKKKVMLNFTQKNQLPAKTPT